MALRHDKGEVRLGAHVHASGVDYRVWSPDRRRVVVQVEREGATRSLPLAADEAGYWSATDPEGRAGDLYRFNLDDGPPLPDVASRFQPEGVTGRSECIDPLSYQWRCETWLRPGWQGQTIYEIHVGSMTEAGSYRAAATRLKQLRELGIDAIEIMPVADFAGDRNWGYDGVALYAPARCYGRPDELRALVDSAHRAGLAVILDVVYNHVGPQGSYLREYCADYFRNDQHTPWGSSFNLDGNRSGPVRHFLLTNALYWMDEFRVDGLRLDATHAIPDSSSPHLLAEIAEIAHSKGVFVIAEDDRNMAALLVSKGSGGFGFDAAWADDFHHQIRVALTGTRKSYFAAYKGAPEDICDTLVHGWTYRGQAYPPWNGRTRGSSPDLLQTSSLIFCIENHDQVGNRARGERLENLVPPSLFRAASMLLCLCPYPILLFMGQEWASSSPFLYFTHHGGVLGKQILEGRRREFGGPEESDDSGRVPDPESDSTFLDSKLKWNERRKGIHAAALRLYTDSLGQRTLLKRAGALEKGNWSVHRSGSFVAISYATPMGRRALVFSFAKGKLSDLKSLGLPAISPGASWEVVLDSESSKFGGSRAAAELGSWPLKGPAAFWLRENPSE